MPKLWSATIEAHRSAVRAATLDTAAALVAAHGLRSVTMSGIAEQTGIGRATLYKYFPDVEAILVAWHERQIAQHIERLKEARDRSSAAGERLRAVLGTFALIARESHAHRDNELAAVLHQDPRVAEARREVERLVSDLVAQAASAGEVRDDVAPDELAAYCLHALAAASAMPTDAAVGRLVTVTLAGLRPTS